MQICPFGVIQLKLQIVLDVIVNDYKILFRESPVPYSIENRSSRFSLSVVSWSALFLVAISNSPKIFR